MRLFIMRHGPSEDSAPSGRDFDRPLSARGRARTAAVARELSRRGECPNLVVSSPLLRAMQTAELVRATFGAGQVDVRAELAPAEDAHGLVLELLAGAHESVLVVSHAPDVSLLAERLLGERVPSFNPATIFALDLTKDGRTKRFVLDPEELES